jgi:hypothetical protein
MLAALLASFTAGAAETVLYKSTMPDGKIVYSEKPVPGAKRVDTIQPPPPQTGMTAVTPQERVRASTSASAATAAARQNTTLNEARDALQKAEAARKAGEEPLPGERQGTAGGASRLTDAYFQRQKGLESAVEAAKKRVQDLERSK